MLVHTRIFCGALFATTLVVGGCSTADEAPAENNDAAASVTINNQWAKAADNGMTAVFGTLTNTGSDDVRIVSASSPAAERVELHEVATDPTAASVMREKAGGFVLRAGGGLELAPGGDHLMLMGIESALMPGSDVDVTVVFDDDSTLPFAAQVRDFAGADEGYRSVG